MDDKIRCQSCGMPLSDTFGNFGTRSDGSKHADYCIICFQKGRFTNPQQTMEEMIQSSIENMTTDLQMPEAEAHRLANAVIPGLKRWQQT